MAVETIARALTQDRDDGMTGELRASKVRSMDAPVWITNWLTQAPGSLSTSDIEDLAQFGKQIQAMFDDRGPADGSALERLVLCGNPREPTLAVVFRPSARYAGVRYSYEWRLRDGEDPSELDELGVMLVDYLGNPISEDLSTSPGLPGWEPDDNGVIHVEVRSERYEGWPREWAERGMPWRDERGRHWYDLVPPSPAAGRSRQRDLALLLRAFRLWASARSDIRAIALVGSWARGGAAERSDVDFVVDGLSCGPGDACETDIEFNPFGCSPSGFGCAPTRPCLAAGLAQHDEREFGRPARRTSWLVFGNDGTRQVLSGGLQRIYDVDKLLLDLQWAAQAR
jgi:hypothetical protein